MKPSPYAGLWAAPNEKGGMWARIDIRRVSDILPCSFSLPFRGPFLQKDYLIGIVIKLLHIINTLKTRKKFWEPEML